MRALARPASEAPERRGGPARPRLAAFTRNCHRVDKFRTQRRDEIAQSESRFCDDSGATAIEHALIRSRVALVVSLAAPGTRLSGEFSQVSVALK